MQSQIIISFQKKKITKIYTTKYTSNAANRKNNNNNNNKCKFQNNRINFCYNNLNHNKHLKNWIIKLSKNELRFLIIWCKWWITLHWILLIITILLLLIKKTPRTAILKTHSTTVNSWLIRKISKNHLLQRRILSKKSCL